MTQNNKIKILIIDDSALLRQSLSSIISENNNMDGSSY